ncbi:hypothetical protein FRB94_004128 [Tulasnella sp. JGI-2019a]|nr:hypothetical protein FRB94_004128 [Tulasnella sp. JGI-2019a]KAG9016839.1 hypothetical protein FRB93_009368 [Tulasnella sp. JGI-2019a]KAG9040264.1 hypothetical protein FRB95_000194 [Tulasnella sp. JGI-2019a]
MSVILAPLASLQQIERTPSREDGIPEDLEDDLRTYGCKLIQQAGILLKQNQVAMATAQVLFQRFWYVTSMKQFGIGDVGMGALYLASKLEESPIRMRDLINVYDLLLSRAQHTLSSSTTKFQYEPTSYFASTFYDLKDALVVAEMQILKRLGFNVQVQHGYGTLVNYLQLLSLTTQEDVPQKAWSYLNDALQTPVYALYPSATIAAAAIFLTCRQLQIPLPSNPEHPWWELFDSELEDIMSICGAIQRLYRPRSDREKRLVMTLVSKKEVRKWLETDGSRVV